MLWLALDDVAGVDAGVEVVVGVDVEVDAGDELGAGVGAALLEDDPPPPPPPHAVVISDMPITASHWREMRLNIFVGKSNVFG